MFPRSTMVIGAACIFLMSLAPAADAKIACNKGNQLVQGSWISTPYCRDGYVAEVARDYGFTASAAEVRNNPMYKQRLCRFIGQDIRIKEACDEVNPAAGRGFY